MKKWLAYGVLILCIGTVWWWYLETNNELAELETRIESVKEAGDPEELVPELQSRLKGKEGTKIFHGILLSFLSAGLVGIAFVLDILPMLAHKATHAIYDSGEMVERDVMHDARSLLAQGEYGLAVEAFREAAAAEPDNRFPWVEMAKIQRENLHDAPAAVATLRAALEAHEWPVDDAAFFMFRLVELYDEALADRPAGIGILEQIIEIFPETRHSANARHKLGEWEQQAVAAAADSEPPRPA